MKLKYEFIIREVGDRYVAVAVGDNAEEFHGIIRMNKSGKIMMELLKNEITETDLLTKLMEQYEGTEEFFKGEINKFVGGLRNAGVIVS
ncbi:MAG: PqqD family protein [Lachnospiraceae bacterium]|nr:PqqD family protein [Lachnospiraceae bacterium]